MSPMQKLKVLFFFVAIISKSRSQLYFHVESRERVGWFNEIMVDILFQCFRLMFVQTLFALTKNKIAMTFDLQTGPVYPSL